MRWIFSFILFFFLIIYNSPLLREIHCLFEGFFYSSAVAVRKMCFNDGRRMGHVHPLSPFRGRFHRHRTRAAAAYCIIFSIECVCVQFDYMYVVVGRVPASEFLFGLGRSSETGQDQDTVERQSVRNERLKRDYTARGQNYQIDAQDPKRETVRVHNNKIRFPLLLLLPADLCEYISLLYSTMASQPSRQTGPAGWETFSTIAALSHVHISSSSTPDRKFWGCR